MKKLTNLIVLVLAVFVSTVAFAAMTWSSGTYSNNANISKVLEVPGATSIRIKITGATEKSYDYLYVYDQSGNQIAVLDGSIEFNKVISGSKVTVRLVTDFSITAIGVFVNLEGFYSQNTHANSTVQIGSGQLLPKPQIANIPSLMRQNNWPIAANLMDHWLGKTGKNYDIGDLDNVLNIASDAKSQFNDWKDSNNIFTFTYFNQDGDFKNGGQVYQSELIKALGKLQVSGASVLLNGGKFDFISSELSLTGNGWMSLSQEIQETSMNYIGERAFGNNDVSYATAVIGKGALRLLAKGTVTVSNKQVATIRVEEFGVYLRDSYDFVQSFQPLGCWSYSSPYVAVYSISPLYNCLYNSTFRDSGLGSDFRIFSSAKRFIPKGGSASFAHQLTGAEYQSYGGVSGNISEFANRFRGYFGEATSNEYSCYGPHVCQDFSYGRKIGISISTRQLYWYDGNGWNVF